MRIMIVTDQYPPTVGGIPTVTHNLAVDLANRDHKVWVIAPSDGPRDLYQLEQTVHTYRFSSLEWFNKDVRIPLLPVMAIRQLIKQANPDVIHIHMSMVLGRIALMQARSQHKPTIMTNHSLPINISYSLANDPLIGRYFSKITYKYLVNFSNSCGFVTAPTMTALKQLYKHGLRSPAKPISNGIDLRKFAPGKTRNPALLRQYGLPEDRPLVIHVNRLYREKRVDVLLEAVAQMRNNAHFALLGSGPEEENLRELVHQLGIGDRVSFLGVVRGPNLLSLLQTAQLFVIPSEGDTQSLATMEAMACGLPVVAANAYALPELVHHEKNGFLFKPGNSAELARYVDILLANPDLRSRMSTQSLRIIAAHDRERILEQWDDLYHAMATKRAFDTTPVTACLS